MKVRKNQILKHLFYSLLLLALYIIQTTPHLLAVGGVKPMTTIGGVVAIALLEKEEVGAVYGIIGGLLCDVSGFVLFGFNTLMLFIWCVIIGLLATHYLKPRLITYMLLVAAVTFSVLGLQFVFIYGIWGLQSLVYLFMQNVAWITLYTLLISPLIYFAYTRINTRFSGE